MFNFRLFDGSLTTRLFVALTVALCIFSILTLTLDAREMMPEAQVKEQEESGEDTAIEKEAGAVPETGHIHEGDPVKGTGCYARPIYHEHTGSKKKGGGCYGKEIIHTHSGDSQNGGGCYGEAIFHTHSGSSQGGGCYGTAIYHSHTGNSTTGGGCYGKPIFHSHQGDETQGGACYATPIYHQHEGQEGTPNPNGCYTKEYRVNIGTVCGTFFDMGDGQWKCGNCGWVIPDWNVPYDRLHWPQVMETRYMLGCGKTQETVEGYALSCTLNSQFVESYELNCGKHDGWVEWYQLSCGKNETTVDGYRLNCGLEEGQVTGYKRTCGMTEETIIGYELSCEQKESLPKEELDDTEEGQPVKVPLVIIDSAEDSAEEKTSREKELSTEEKISIEENKSNQIATKSAAEDSFKEPSLEFETKASSLEGFPQITMPVLLFLLLLTLGKWYVSKTLALFYYDEEGQYHSLGRIFFRRSNKGYHVQIGNTIRRKATTDKYRIRTHRQMQKKAEKQHLYVRISTQVMKLPLEEYVDFAL